MGLRRKAPRSEPAIQAAKYVGKTNTELSFFIYFYIIVPINNIRNFDGYIYIYITFNFYIIFICT